MNDGMKFFVPKPFVTTMNGAQRAHKCMRDFAHQKLDLNVTDRKVYQIDYVCDGELWDACVGEPEHDSGEMVIAILDAPRQYLICTPEHGGYGGKPIVVGKQHIESVIEFEE